jgi:hypothetical protein
MVHCPSATCVEIPIDNNLEVAQHWKFCILVCILKRLVSTCIALGLVFSIHHCNTSINNRGGGFGIGLSLIVDLWKSFLSSLSKSEKNMLSYICFLFFSCLSFIVYGMGFVDVGLKNPWNTIISWQIWQHFL